MANYFSTAELHGKRAKFSKLGEKKVAKKKVPQTNRIIMVSAL